MSFVTLSFNIIVIPRIQYQCQQRFICCKKCSEFFTIKTKLKDLQKPLQIMNPKSSKYAYYVNERDSMFKMWENLKKAEVIYEKKMKQELDQCQRYYNKLQQIIKVSEIEVLKLITNLKEVNVKIIKQRQKHLEEEINKTQMLISIMEAKCKQEANSSLSSFKTNQLHTTHFNHQPTSQKVLNLQFISIKYQPQIIEQFRSQIQSKYSLLAQENHNLLASQNHNLLASQNHNLLTEQNHNLLTEQNHRFNSPIQIKIKDLSNIDQSMNSSSQSLLCFEEIFDRRKMQKIQESSKNEANMNFSFENDTDIIINPNNPILELNEEEQSVISPVFKMF